MGTHPICAASEGDPVSMRRANWPPAHQSAYGEYPSDRTRLGHEWPLAVTRHVEVDLIRWIWAFIDRPLERFDQAVAFWANVTDSRLSTRRGSDSEL
jgi:hypothetical protein